MWSVFLLFQLSFFRLFVLPFSAQRRANRLILFCLHCVVFSAFLSFSIHFFPYWFPWIQSAWDAEKMMVWITRFQWTMKTQKVNRITAETQNYNCFSFIFDFHCEKFLLFLLIESRPASACERRIKWSDEINGKLRWMNKCFLSFVSMFFAIYFFVFRYASMRLKMRAEMNITTSSRRIWVCVAFALLPFRSIFFGSSSCCDFLFSRLRSTLFNIRLFFYSLQFHFAYNGFRIFFHLIFLLFVFAVFTNVCLFISLCFSCCYWFVVWAQNQLCKFSRYISRCCHFTGEKRLAN